MSSDRREFFRFKDITKEKKRCGVEGCPSRRLHFDETGVAVCENGHQHPEIDRPDEDDDDYASSQGRTTRKARERVEKPVQRFEGKRGFELYLVSYQLILRKQIWWLIKERGLPAELENLTHSLWALRLQRLTPRIPLDTISDAESSQALFSSQSSSSTSALETDTPSPQTYGNKDPTHHPMSTPRLEQSLALIHMTLYILKLPVTLGDIFTWVRQGKLLYYAAVREVPSDVLERLAASYHDALDPSTLLTEHRLWKSTTRLFLQYRREFGMQIPRLNFHLHLHRYIIDLGMPLPVYAAAKRIAEILGWGFEYPDPMKRRGRLRIVDFPEAQVAAVFVVAVKILYPFDGWVRHPHSAEELGSVGIDWGVWSEATTRYEKGIKGQRLGYEGAMRVTEEDVQGMSEERIDEYLDWYRGSYMNELNVTERSREAEFRKYLLQTFPVERNGKESGEKDDEAMEEAKVERLNRVVSSMVPREVVADKDEDRASVLRPGQGYKRYRKVEDMLPVAKQFFEAAAKLVGFDLNMLMKAVFLTEVKLETWMVKEKWKEHGKRKYTYKKRNKRKRKVEEGVEDATTSEDE